MLLNMYDGYYLNLENIINGVDNFANNSNYSLTEIFNMSYYEFVMIRGSRKRALEKQESQQEGYQKKYGNFNPQSVMSSIPKPSMPKLPNIPKP